jgi:hypothetical protein
METGPATTRDPRFVRESSYDSGDDLSSITHAYENNRVGAPALLPCLSINTSPVPPSFSIHKKWSALKDELMTKIQTAGVAIRDIDLVYRYRPDTPAYEETVTMHIRTPMNGVYPPPT